MSNYRRNFIPGGTFFFTLVTHQRRQFLATPAARCCLREALRKVRRDWPFALDAIVLLPDHLHCIWTLPPGDAAYDVRWKRIKHCFTTSYLSAGGSEGAISASRASKRERGIWQKRYYEHTVRDDDDLKRCVDYIHVNPLKHGLVARVRDWPWSSFHRYVTLGEYSPDWGGSPKFYGDEWLRHE
jgi:putative transposase